MEQTVTRWMLWLIVGSLIVLVIMNAQQFATAVSAVGSQVQGVMTTLSGSGYKRSTG